MENSFTILEFCKSWKSINQSYLFTVLYCPNFQIFFFQKIWTLFKMNKICLFSKNPQNKFLFQSQLINQNQSKCSPTFSVKIPPNSPSTSKFPSISNPNTFSQHPPKHSVHSKTSQIFRLTQHIPHHVESTSNKISMNIKT